MLFTFIISNDHLFFIFDFHTQQSGRAQGQDICRRKDINYYLFNIEDINKKFAELSDTLDAIKTQNALNIGDTSRMLNNFGTKLDTVSDYINSEEMLELIADLKHSITDKYSVVTVKFAELETSLKEIQNSGNEIVTLPQMRELFDVLSTNITVFSPVC